MSPLRLSAKTYNNPVPNRIGVLLAAFVPSRMAIANVSTLSPKGSGHGIL